jgi:hypothetical protein
MIRLKTYFNKSLAPVIISLLLLLSCTSSEVKMIPTRDLVDILHDFYLADGMLSEPEIRSSFAGRDSIENYIDVLNEYGYTIDELEKTLKYLYIKNPDKLVKIYDRVLLRFSELDSKLNSIQYNNALSLNSTWSGKDFYHFPSRSKNETGYFTHKIIAPGKYLLKYEVLVSPADETYNPGFFGWTVSADSALTGKKYYLPGTTYLKDGRWRLHYVQIRVSKPTLLEGYLYNHNDNSKSCYIDAMIRNISLEITGAL